MYIHTTNTQQDICLTPPPSCPNENRTSGGWDFRSAIGRTPPVRAVFEFFDAVTCMCCRRIYSAMSHRFNVYLETTRIARYYVRTTNCCTYSQQVNVTLRQGAKRRWYARYVCYVQSPPYYTSHTSGDTLNSCPNHTGTYYTSSCLPVYDIIHMIQTAVRTTRKANERDRSFRERSRSLLKLLY